MPKLLPDSEQCRFRPGDVGALKEAIDGGNRAVNLLLHRVHQRAAQQARALVHQRLPHDEMLRLQAEASALDGVLGMLDGLYQDARVAAGKAGTDE